MHLPLIFAAPQPLNRHERRRLEAANRCHSNHLQAIPREAWPAEAFDQGRIEVWRSRAFLVQVFQEQKGTVRMSVCRTTARPNGTWVDGITWDDLQRCKREIGRRHLYAVEVYPEDSNIVNVANMRHLWILPTALGIGWVRSGGGR